MIPPVAFFIFNILGYDVLAIIFLILTITDVMDGAVARMTGKTSLLGAFLDSTLDRISDTVIITSFGFAGTVRWEFVCAFLAFSLMTSYVRAMAENKLGKDVKLEVGMIERPERILGIIAGTLIFFWYPDSHIWNMNILELSFSFMSVLAAITVLQRIFIASLLIHKLDMMPVQKQNTTPINPRKRKNRKKAQERDLYGNGTVILGFPFNYKDTKSYKVYNYLMNVMTADAEERRRK